MPYWTLKVFFPDLRGFTQSDPAQTSTSSSLLHLLLSEEQSPSSVRSVNNIVAVLSDDGLDCGILDELK